MAMNLSEIYAEGGPSGNFCGDGRASDEGFLIAAFRGQPDHARSGACPSQSLGNIRSEDAAN